MMVFGRGFENRGSGTLSASGLGKDSRLRMGRVSLEEKTHGGGPKEPDGG